MWQEYDREKILQCVVLEKLDSHMQRNEIRVFPHTMYKNKLKMY